ncbi:MAG: LysR substrate-binding domain-containing protein [Woeseiaceae bacterium]|nr:LysR substrate-binding domain-containing protein [Woeseiaceae bacterium]
MVAPAEILDAQLGTLLREFERIRGCEIEVIPTSVGGRSVDATAPADMAIAWRPSRDSAALSTRLIDVERATYASPAYIEDRGLPSTPAEVKTHSCLSCANDDQFATWRYSKGAKLIRVRVRTTSPFADTAALRGATLAGAGIARLPKFLADQFIRCGRLVEILPEYTTSTCPLYAISSAEGNDPLMVAALRLFLEERLNLAS